MKIFVGIIFIFILCSFVGNLEFSGDTSVSGIFMRVLNRIEVMVFINFGLFIVNLILSVFNIVYN